MKFVELKKQLKAAPPRACYACIGDDEYLIARAVALISDVAGGIREFNVVDRTFERTQDAVEELMQLPVGGQYRVVISRGKLDADELEEYIRNPNPSSVLVMTAFVPHDSWNHAPVFSFPVGVETVDCNRLDVKFTYGFVRSVTDAAGTKISDAAIELLYARCGGYMSRINSEINKLSVMRAGEEITQDDVASSVRADDEFIVFELGDSIIKRDPKRALSIVDGMAKNNDLVAAFTLLYNRFRKAFAIAVDPDGVGGIGVSPYQASKARADAAAFSKSQLKSVLDMLSEADAAYKSGLMSQYDALTSFVAKAAYGGEN